MFDMRIIVCGSRTFDDYKLLKKVLDKITRKMSKFTIMSGGQVSMDKKTGHKYGADYLGEKWAMEEHHNIGRATLEIYRADWKKDGKAAGPIRNTTMLKAEPGGLVCFWDGKSPGTKDVLTKARKIEGLKIKVVRF